MHIMVNKRYTWKLDTCAGHEALIIKLLVKKPPGIMSADSTSIVRERCASRPFKALMNRVWEEKDKQKADEVKKIWTGGKRQTLSPALCIESLEAGCIPWVRLESVIRHIS